ncbi:MAG: hypothetical protein AB9873_17305 [Syntrophobacteraceae bacterium]
MEEMPDWVVWGVVVVAFLAGYGIVSLVLKRMKDLQSRPSMMDDLWQEDRSMGRSRETTEAMSPPEGDPGKASVKTINRPENSNPQ